MAIPKTDGDRMKIIKTAGELLSTGDDSEIVNMIKLIASAENQDNTIDYIEGIIQLNSFNPLGVDDPLGLFAVTANPQTTIISSSFNRIITVDQFDTNSVVVNLIAKS